MRGSCALLVAIMMLAVAPAFANGEGPSAPAAIEQPPAPVSADAIVRELIDFQPRTLLQDEAVQEDRRGAGHELLGVIFHPYAGLTLTRVSGFGSREGLGVGEGDWSTGFKVGMEIDAGSLFVGVSVHLRDILSDTEVIPWDTDVEFMLGGYM